MSIEVGQYTQFLDHIDEQHIYIDKIEKENYRLKQDNKDNALYIKQIEMDLADKNVHIIAMHKDLERLESKMLNQELIIEKRDIIKRETL